MRVQFEKVRFEVQKLTDSQKRRKAHDWVLVHDQIIAAIAELGHDCLLVEPNAPPSADADRIFIGMHTFLRGPNIWNVKKAYLPGFLYFDRSGYSGWAEMAGNPKLFQTAMKVDDGIASDFFSRLHHETVGANVSKVIQSSEPFQRPARRFIFWPMQLSYDSVIRLSRIAYFSFYEAIRDWAEKQGFDLVLKAHPNALAHPLNGKVDDVSVAVLNDAARRAHVHSTTASIHKIIPQCEIVFCINSGVGFESLIHRKPVVAAGHSDYHWATHNVTSPDDIAAIPPDLRPVLSEAETRRFLYYFLNEYLVDVRKPDSTRRKIETTIQALCQSRSSGDSEG